MRVIISPRAEADLLDIEHYIALDSPRNAHRQATRIQLACASLANAPLRFAVIRRRGEIEVRRLVEGRYSIFYVVRLNSVFVARILHAGQADGGGAALQRIDILHDGLLDQPVRRAAHLLRRRADTLAQSVIDFDAYGGGHGWE